jgi:uncharacterized protein YjbI with pentapeptide repeats
VTLLLMSAMGLNLLSTATARSLIPSASRSTPFSLTMIYHPDAGAVTWDGGGMEIRSLQVISTVDFWTTTLPNDGTIGPNAPPDIVPPFGVWTPQKAFALLTDGGVSSTWSATPNWSLDDVITNLQVELDLCCPYYRGEGPYLYVGTFSDGIFRWDNAHLIPGTEGVVQGPGMVLENLDLRFASLSEMDLTGSSFKGSNLRHAKLDAADLSTANLTTSDLTDANLALSNVTNASFTDATVTRTNFYATIGFTREQLYSTASYKDRDLTGVSFWFLDLSGWDFSGQNLTGASLAIATLTDANLTDAIVTGALLANTTPLGLTQAQLASTASYKARDLQGIGLDNNDLTGWNFSGQNLRRATLGNATLANANLRGTDLTDTDLWLAVLADADLTDALVNGASLGFATQNGFTPEQLYSTASYQAKDLQRIRLTLNDLTGWDFSGQNLTGASLWQATLTNANLSRANFTGADLEQATLTNANLTGANLKNALLAGASMDSAVVDSETTYNQWTVFPDGFNPEAAGLSFVRSSIGDYDADDLLDADDIDMLARRFQGVYYGGPDTMFDVNSDLTVDLQDLDFWVHEIGHTYFGDTNLDGEFNSTDLLNVFSAGEYEDDVAGNSGWSTGDWDADGEFTSSDLVVALADGGYEQGPRAAAAAVPEPASLALVLTGLVGAICRPGRPPRMGRRTQAHLVRRRQP